MEIEDGLIWFYGVGEDGVQAFAATTGRAVLEAGGKSKFFVQANYAFGGLGALGCPFGHLGSRGEDVRGDTPMREDRHAQR